MPGSLPVSTILFGLISAFLTIPGFHAAEPVPVPTEASGIPFIGETSPTVSPEVPPEEGRIVFIENTALPSGQTAEPIAVPTETLSVLIPTEAPAIAPTAMQAPAATEEIPAAPAEGMSLAEMKVWLAERQATQTVVAVVNAPEPAPVSEPEPYTCLLPKARMGFENTCLTSPQTPEFSINIDWQPRFETHIAGVAAAGIFAEIRVKITNLSGRTWHGLTPGSFFLMEDLPDSDVAIEYRIHEAMTVRKSNSFQVNQLEEDFLPGQAKSYYLIFDIPKHSRAQTLIFRAEEIDGGKAAVRYKFQLPDYVPLEDRQ